MRQAFQDESTNAVLLIDASNAFNCLNRAVALHNIQITCPKIAAYLINTYRHPSNLFIAGGKKILSSEGTTQGDPMAMGWYSLSTTPLIESLVSKYHSNRDRDLDPGIRQVWLADDASAAGSISKLKQWYESLVEDGKMYGYHVNRKKSWLIVKSTDLEEEAHSVSGNSVKITRDNAIWVQ